jgi:hypothetical protein
MCHGDHDSFHTMHASDTGIQSEYVALSSMLDPKDSRDSEEVSYRRESDGVESGGDAPSHAVPSNDSYSSRDRSAGDASNFGNIDSDSHDALCDSFAGGGDDRSTCSFFVRSSRLLHLLFIFSLLPDELIFQ